jgi:hypothetical protein
VRVTSTDGGDCLCEVFGAHGFREVRLEAGGDAARDAALSAMRRYRANAKPLGH